MKPKALIVEDDDRIIGSIEDTLFSIGHEHDWATNQHDAQQMLQDSDYSYVLLDLQIPAKPNRGGADKEFGCNLLRDIQHIKGRGRTPVIVMTAYSADCLDLSTELYANGASEFIAKPFSNKGRTLASVIRKVLDKQEPPLPTQPPPIDKPPPTQIPFAGGELVFHADRITLCDVTVLVNSRAKQMRKILDELRRRGTKGAFVARSGPELVDLTGIRGGQNSVAGAVRDFRNNVTETLLEHLGIVCGSQDIIRSGGPGYRLNEWITIRVAESEAEKSSDANDAPAEDPDDGRRERILAELRKGEKLRAPAIAARLGCCTKTVKRELDALRTEGQVEFIGPSKTGHYRLTE